MKDKLLRKNFREFVEAAREAKKAENELGTRCEKKLKGYLWRNVMRLAVIKYDFDMIDLLIDYSKTPSYRERITLLMKYAKHIGVNV